MTYLADANVLSEPTKPQPSAAVEEWIEANSAELVVNGIILGEIQLGILLLPAGKKRRALEKWFDELRSSLRCLEWDGATGLRWAELLADLRRRGEQMPLHDGMIAATALQHGLTVATRNTRDFARGGVPIINPFEV